ncbi:MAG TPA: OmpA family protein [Cyclobacteriaceae bacterium]|nr:OmpA family protein [Cyclobacteriaceae bacterium]HRJ81053.1 OmpA family protein [Cyclobacteriaceae bacterium]
MKKLILPFFLLALSFMVLAQEYAPRYAVVKLNKEVNTYYHDAAPIISFDGKKLYFFIHNHPQNTFGKEGSDDIWVSTVGENGEWSAPQHLTAPYNIHRSNQVFTALPDGSLFIKGGRVKDTKGFSIVSAGGSLTELDVPGFKEMNKGRFYGASMSANMKHMIIFFSETPSSTRSSLYVSNLGSDGKWSRPVKLNISVKDDDFGPFIGPDDKTLYFASDRNVAGKFGKSDIYKTTRLDDSWQNWSEPVNMGAPINTAGGEMYFCIDREGHVYMSRAVIGAGGTLDLFKLIPRDITIRVSGTIFNEKTQQPIPANVQVKPADHEAILLHAKGDGKYETKIPEVNGFNVAASQEGFLPKDISLSLPVLGNDTTLYVDLYLTPVVKKLVLAGTIYDSKTMKPVAAKLQVQLKNDRSVNLNLQAGAGTYEQEIKKLGWYMLTASAEGYLNAADSVEVINEELTPVIKDLILQPIEVGLTVRLKNIYFDFDKTTLKKESFVELNKVVDFLKQNHTVEIQIEGHTDSKGSDEYNLNLSQGRSQSVVDYIVSQGIDGARLRAQGYGESKPIDTNDTDAGRANNRRVEFTVVKK